MSRTDAPVIDCIRVADPRGDLFVFRRAKGNRNAFLLLKILTLLLGGAVTILAALNSSAALTASLAAAIVAAEGIQQLFKLQRVWLDYQRSGCGATEYAVRGARGPGCGRPSHVGHTSGAMGNGDDPMRAFLGQVNAAGSTPTSSYRTVVSV